MSDPYVTPGLMAICMTCRYQDREEDNGRATCCLHPGPCEADGSCSGYQILEGNDLGPRLAELYNYTDILNDMVVALMDIVENHVCPGGGEVER